MHDRSHLLADRVQRILTQRLRPAMYSERTPLEVFKADLPVDGEPVPIQEGLRARYRPFSPGTSWGPPWSTTWFRLDGRVPTTYAGTHAVAIIDLGFHGGAPGFQAEGLLLDTAGAPITGLHPLNHIVPLRPPGERVRGGEPIRWFVEAAGNPDILSENGGNTRNSDPLTSDPRPQYVFRAADLAIRVDDVYHLVLDLEVLEDLRSAIRDDDPRRFEIGRAIEACLDQLDVDDVVGTAHAARERLAPLLARGTSPFAHRVSAVGHAHIDTAWLWPLRETHRKAARTFANVLHLAESYPEIVFAGPQAQQYAWVKARHPDLWRRLQAAVRAGTWVPVGGAWVEADGNLPGGEALARQLVHGKRFFRDELGVTTHGVWLPDSFGYTAAYPQVARLAGNDWFLTQKLSWNDTNRFPHHTFWWEGLDGTRIFTHFPPADTYNGSVQPSELRYAVAGFKDKGVASRSLYPFGYGDGGGGPTPEMMERARRVADLDGLPRVHVEPPDAFFAAAQQEGASYDMPVWRGELYLELHRGTFTTQARGKAFNRRCEHMLREAELWAATAWTATNGHAPYPYDELDTLWKTVLTLQFHDILPGSSITWVHRQAEEMYVEIVSRLEILVRSAVDQIAIGTLAEGPRAVDSPPHHEVKAHDVMAFNAGPDSRVEVVTLPAGGLALASAPALGVGTVWDPLIDGPAIPFGLRSVTLEPSDDGWVLDNGVLRVVVDAAGLITSLAAYPGLVECVAPGGSANLLQIHPDTPSHWDAWDLEEHYRHTVTDLDETAAPARVSLVERGPLRAAIHIVRAYGSSTITQTLRLSVGSDRLDIVTDIDWHEREKVLKAAFPLDLLADAERAEIQYGHVTRPIHENTSWDAARFEMPLHRWVHVGEADHGVALVTDSTYGHDVRRSVSAVGAPVTTVRLTLLRSPLAPDPSADQGRHAFTYAVLPGSVAAARRAGYALNLPLRVVDTAFERPPTATPPAPIVTVRGEGDVVVEAVKLADDRSGDLVVRLYEAAGGRGRITLVSAAPIHRAWACDLLEEPLPGAVETFELDGTHGVPLDVRPFQITTVRLTLRKDTVVP